MNREEAEILRIKSEVAKNEAEQVKALREAEEIGRRLKVFSKESISKVVVGGIVAAVLLAAWFINVQKPLSDAGQKLEWTKNETLKYQIQRQAQ